MSYKLLLADDSVTIQRVIELTFADEDIQVVAVSDGDQAIAQLEVDPPDIVLADIGMPGRDGYEVAAYVKNSPRLSHIPVVLLTGAFEPVDQARADSVGCDGVLAKPFEPQLVIGRVKELLGHAGRAPVLAGAKLSPSPVPAAAPWSPTLVEPANHAASPGAAKPPGDEYFDRLDAAFATLSNGSAPAAKPAGASGPIADSIDWFTTKPAAGPVADLPLSYGSPQADLDRPPAPKTEPVQPRASVATAAPATVTSAPAVRPAPRPALPPLADAFAAMLAAEQSGSAPASAPAWPGSAGATVAVTDELIEQVTRRVLEQLSDRVVRETATEIVSAIAERLVREEIERIKAAIHATK